MSTTNRNKKSNRKYIFQILIFYFEKKRKFTYLIRTLGAHDILLYFSIKNEKQKKL